MTKAFIIGRITKDLELKETNNQKSVVSFTLACDNGYGDNKQTAFIECVAWNQMAENLCVYQKKGSLIGLSGNIRTRSYEKDGKKVYITEVVADKIEYLGANVTNTKKEPATITENFFNEITNDDLPF